MKVYILNHMNNSLDFFNYVFNVFNECELYSNIDEIIEKLKKL